MSIVDIIKDQLSGDLIGKLSAAVGESEEKTTAAAGAAVPAVLSSLANMVLSGKGLESLLEAIRGYDGFNPAEPLPPPAGDPADADAPGGDILGSLLGFNLSALVGILSRFSGVGATVIRSLLGYLGPIILSAVAAQLKAKGGLTPANLTSFLAAEKPSITAALPHGLSLADLPSIPGVPTSVPTPSTSQSGMPPWLIPAMIVGFLALAAYFTFMAPPPEDPAPGAIRSAPKSADELARTLSDTYAGANRILARVTDPATAEAAAPAIEALNTLLDNLKVSSGYFQDDARTAIAEVTRKHLDPLRSIVGKVLEIPGVAEKLRPTLEVLLARLAGLAA